MPTKLDQQISESRFLLQNPYAYLDGEGNYAASSLDGAGYADSLTTVLSDTFKPKSHNKPIPYNEIEKIVINLQRHLYMEQESIFGKGVHIEPIDILDPAIVFGLLGYEFDGEASLAQYRTEEGMAQIAGYFDPVNKYVGISNQYRRSVQRFTAAHELGHAVLHGNSVALHRDRPLSGGVPFEGRDQKEKEADKFATYFLMPKKLVVAEFERRFFTTTFEVTDDSAFMLIGKSRNELKMICRKRLGLATLLAQCGRYGRGQIVPMADFFNVSAAAMAIRLEELGLLKY